ncbi:TRAP transporter small permease subunit [Aliiruegeria lutimaris]|uniref:TRAP transporter small permease protein n=1 Tax=Aliiruegeria lutimaris TaxID=571298 RepID=A0A1G8R0U1_9RHOB|nr:TRAP transporter small permease [Aliiruegeria lutimaris]SDJ10594.1 TRAP-type mannitol/chloroaromatic compound transport system, small permease component [Aliiruegeria lutimaris]
MESDSLWLGHMRKPVRLIMLAFVGVTALIYVWLVFNKIFMADAIGMHEMIRPSEGGTIVTIMLYAMLGSLLSAGIYLSDFKGDIELEPDGFFDIFSLVISRISMVLTALIVLVMFYEVISRYVFSRPTLWANELSLWIAAFVFLFAGQYAMQQRSHIRIYVIYDIMPRWAQKASDVLSTLLIVFFTFSMIWGGYNDAKTRALRMETFGTAWDPPLPGTIKAAILIIIVLVTIQAISNLIADWNKLPEHHSGAEVDETEIEHIRQALEK